MFSWGGGVHWGTLTGFRSERLGKLREDSGNHHPPLSGIQWARFRPRSFVFCLRLLLAKRFPPKKTGQDMKMVVQTSGNSWALVGP